MKRIIATIVGLVVLGMYWIIAVVNQLSCNHPSFEPLNKDYVSCLECGKEIWTPFNVQI